MASTFKDLITNTNYFLIEKRDMYRLGELAKQYNVKDWEITNDKRIYEITFNEALAGLESKLSTASGNNSSTSTEYTAFIEGTESNFTTDGSAIKINDYAFYNFSQLGGENRPLTFNAASAMGSHAFEKCINLEAIYGNKMANIGSFAFVGCEHLTNVEFLPKEDQQSSIERGAIEEQAFANCSSLKQFNSPNFNKINSSAFLNCSNLKELYAINADADDTALVGCTALTSLSLGYKQKGTSQNNQTTYKGLNTVAGLRFTEAPNLQTINLPNILSLSGHATSTSKTIAFLSMKNLQQATFSNLTSIGQNAFRGCTGLTTIKGIDNVTTLGSYTFASCTALTTCGNTENQVEFLKVTTIPSSAFISCSAMTTASFPIAETINTKAFNGCTNLSTLYAPKAILKANDAINTCANLTDVTLGIETLTKDIFSAAQASLKTLSLPKATTINGNFQQADVVYSALTTLSISKVSNIGDYAFSGCYNLNNLNLPQQTLVKSNNKYSNTTTIGQYAFQQCIGLSSISIAAQNVTIGSHCFKECGGHIKKEDEDIYIGLTTATIPGSPLEDTYKDTNASSIWTTNRITLNQGAFLGCSQLSSVSIGSPASTATLVIGANAFQGCEKISQDNLRLAAASSITISAYAFDAVTDNDENVLLKNPQLTEINNTIFNCSNLINFGVSAFAGCSTLTNIDLTDNAITYVQALAFAGCDMETITISGTTCLLPSKVNNENNKTAFEQIKNLKTINLKNVAGMTANANSIGSIDKSATAIPTNAFLNATAITLNITGSTAKPSAKAFANTSLQTIDINYLDSWANNTYPFEGTTALTTLKLGLPAEIGTNNLLLKAGSDISTEENGYKGFDLTITGRKWVTASIGEDGVEKPAHYEDTPMTINVNNAFAGTRAKTMTFPNLTAIGKSNAACNQVFSNNTAMTTFNAPKLQSIYGASTFKDCTALTTIELPELTSIPQNTFANCTALNTLNLPKVSSIYENNQATNTYAIFEGCTNLNTLTLGGEDAIIPTIGRQLYSLTALQNATLYVSTITDTFSDFTTLKTLELPKVTTISGSAFYGTKFVGSTPYTLELSTLSSIVVGYKNNSITTTPFGNCHNFNLKLNKLPDIGYFPNATTFNSITITGDHLKNIFKDSDFLNTATTNKCYILLPQEEYDKIQITDPWITNLNLLPC